MHIHRKQKLTIDNAQLPITCLLATCMLQCPQTKKTQAAKPPVAAVFMHKRNRDGTCHPLDQCTPNTFVWESTGREEHQRNLWDLQECITCTWPALEGGHFEGGIKEGLRDNRGGAGKGVLIFFIFFRWVSDVEGYKCL